MPLTVVSAPAGYGKSMMVSHWAESLDRPCVWLSLYTAENDVTDFLEYLLAAVQMSFPDACAQTEAMVISPNAAPIPMLGAAVTAYILGILLNQQQDNAAKWRADLRRRIGEPE